MRIPDPSLATGEYDYRERLVFIQRVVVPSVDFNRPGIETPADRSRRRFRPRCIPSPR
jgi:hypothetical protein